MNYDKNGDGVLSRKEWAQVAESRNQRIFKVAAQGDRFIAEAEFAAIISDEALARRLSVLRDKVATEDADDLAEEAADRVEDDAEEAVKAEKKSQRELKVAETRRERQALDEEREALKEKRKARKKAENAERRTAREQNIVGDD